MSAHSPGPLRTHEDAALFRAAVEHTAAETGFVARLIEKDYFCTVLLQHFAAAAPELIFKGGTCLAKIHLGFYRMSEDLDFVIPTAPSATRGERRKRASNAKRAVDAIQKSIPMMRAIKALVGVNESMQYMAEIEYDSLLGSRRESIKVEVALREELLLAPTRRPAQTLLIDPLSGTAHLSPIEVPCIAREEAMAEKLRAALSRRAPAIRDFYDIDHAARLDHLDVASRSFLRMVRAKLAVKGNDPVDVSPNRLAALRNQLEAQLRPVLRTDDFRAFDLDRAFTIVQRVAQAIDMQ